MAAAMNIHRQKVILSLVQGLVKMRQMRQLRMVFSSKREISKMILFELAMIY